MENTTHLFMAVRFNCNKCHDHPFERWTQNQYYELSAATSRRSAARRIRNSRAARPKGRRGRRRALPLVEIIERRQIGVRSRTSALGKPWLAEVPVHAFRACPPPTASRREQLAKWITAKDNPYFAKSYVNRLWSYLLGVGIIEPVDNIRAGNPPTNPQLLDKLTDEFIKSNFNVQELIQDDRKSAPISTRSRPRSGTKTMTSTIPTSMPAGCPRRCCSDSDPSRHRFAIADSRIAGRARER